MTSNHASQPVNLQKISQMLRSNTLENTNIAHEAKKDLKQAIMTSPRNTLDFYNMKNNVTLPKKMLPHNFPKTYQSIHRLVGTEAKKQMAEVFKETKYSGLEKEALAEIRQEQGKNSLMADLYKELSKEIETTPKNNGASKVAKVVKPESELKEVEDLDKWTQEKIHHVKQKHNTEVEELRKEVNRMMLFIEEAGLTAQDKKAVDSILEEIDASQGKANSFGTFGSPRNEYISPRNGTSLPMIHKGKENTFGNTMGHETIGGNTDSFYSTSTSKLPLKTRLDQYKGLHERIEQKLYKYIREIETELESRTGTIRRLSEQNEKLGKKEKQFIEEINTISDSQKDVEEEFSWALIPGSSVKDAIEKKIAEKKQRLKSLKQQLGKCRRQMEFNDQEISQNEGECVSLKKRLHVFQRIKSKLYLKILKQGLDCREEGLIWVLKDLIKEGENITYEEFPTFLDTTSKAHLLNKSRQLIQLAELKSLEKSLINNFRSLAEIDTSANNQQGLVRQKTLALAEPAVSVLSMPNVINKTPTPKSNRARSSSEFDGFPAPGLNRIESTTSLNDLDLENEEEGEASSQEILELKPLHRKATSISEQKMKAFSLAYIPEERDEEVSVNEKTPQLQMKVKRNNTTHFSKMMSLTDLRRSRNNLNETLAHETRNVLGQICREKGSLSKSQTQYFKPKTEEQRGSFSDSKASAKKAQKKTEVVAKIHSTQSEIHLLIQKMCDDDQKEGVRIVKEYESKKRMDLEFYLACVLGVGLAEKLTKKFALRNSQF